MGLRTWVESGVTVFVFVLHVLVSDKDSWGMATRSLFSTFSADFIGVAHFLADLLLLVDWVEFGGVGVDCMELLVELGFRASDISSYCRTSRTSLD